MIDDQENLRRAIEALKANNLDLAHEYALAAYHANPKRPSNQFVFGKVAAARGDIVYGVRLMLTAQKGAPVPEEILAACSFLQNAPADDLASLCSLLLDIVWELEVMTGGVQATFYATLFLLLRFEKTLEFERLEAIHNCFVFPLMTKAIAADRIDLAYPLMARSYNDYVKAKEEEGHFAKVLKKWEWHWTRAARRYVGAAKTTPSARLPNLPLSSQYRLAFILPTGAKLAHTEALISFLKSYRTGSSKPFTPSVVIFEGEVDGWQPEIEIDGTRVMRVDHLTKSNDLRERADALKSWIARESIVAVVLVSVVHLLPFLFSMPMAPVQIWWALKYHAFSHSEIDGYVTTAPSLRKFVTIHGRKWRNAGIGFHGLFDSSLEDQARRIKAEFPKSAVIFATLAREEKLKGREFLDAVASILQQNQNAYFLWTGKSRDREIEDHLKAAGVAGRVKFIGWVDTRLYAQVLDVFLDSFPFGCGLTICQAMAAGKPAIMFDRPDTRMHHWPALATSAFEAASDLSPDDLRIREIFEFDAARKRSLFFHVTSILDYVSTAHELVQDPVLRSRAGAAARKYAIEFFESSRMALTLTGHIHDIVVDVTTRGLLGRTWRRVRRWLPG